MRNAFRILWPLDMRANVGRNDRIGRALICALLIVAGMSPGLNVDIDSSVCLLALLAIPLYTTAIVAWDPVYDFLGISTQIEDTPTRSWARPEPDKADNAVYVTYPSGINSTGLVLNECGA